MRRVRLLPHLSRRCSTVAYDGPGSTLLPPLARLGLDLTFWRNWIVYTSLTQPPFLSEEFPSASQSAVLPREQCVEWCPPKDAAPGPSAAVESPHQPGLWLLRGALTTEQCAAVAASVRALTRNHAVQGCDGVPVRAPCSPLAFGPGDPPPAQPAWEWFEYWPARCMVPLQPQQRVSKHLVPTRHFEAHPPALKPHPLANGCPLGPRRGRSGRSGRRWGHSNRRKRGCYDA